MKGANQADSSPADDEGATTAATVLWKAAADAIVWRASIRDHAARRELKKAWVAMAEAEGELRLAAEACGRAVDAQGRRDSKARGRAMAATRVAADMLLLAVKALARSSRLYRKAGAGLKRASRAYGRAAEPKHAAGMRERAARAHAHGRVSAGIAANVRRHARKLVRSADRVDAGEAELPLAGGADMLSSVDADMRVSAGRAGGAESNGTGADLEEAVRAAYEVQKVCAEAAKLSAAEAARAVSDCGDGGGPDVKKAEAAWRKAVAAANRADAGGR